MSTIHEANPVKQRYANGQQIFLVLLRLAIGWHFLYEGLTKLFSPGWTSADYLDLSRWVFAPIFHWIAETPTALAIADFLNIWGLIAVGLGLILGIATKWASIGGMALLFLYYVANPPLVKLDFGVPSEGSYLVVDKNVIEFLALAVLAFFPTGKFAGLERFFTSPKATEENQDEELPQKLAHQPALDQMHLKHRPPLERRDLLKGLATLPVMGALGFALMKKKEWESFEEQNLVDAYSGASTKSLNATALAKLEGQIPMASIKGVPFSRMILGGNLLSGWAHSRDLIYVSQLVKAYHKKEKIFETLLLAEKCGINTLLTNPIICRLLDEYWKRGIGKIQFISDLPGLSYDNEGNARPIPFQEYLDVIKRAIDHGASACYIQGETADRYVQQGNFDYIEKALELIRDNGLPAGIGAHHLHTVKACHEKGFNPDFWMKTLHHHNYWSARHHEEHDNMYCYKPAETIAFMEQLPQPWIAFKVLAAGSIKPQDGFRYAFENGADFICVGMYDFQMVDDVNIAYNILKKGVTRNRPWMA